MLGNAAEAEDRGRAPRRRRPLVRGDRPPAHPGAGDGALEPAPRAPGPQGEAGRVPAVTCHEAREMFSAAVDDALVAGKRSALDAHLVGCADCRRELDRFRQTVALVQALPPERAPAGFVDRVVARARPAPWPARLVRGLFVPWTKLPLEAAAILLVGGLAVWVFQRTPEQQQSARLEQAPPRGDAPAHVEPFVPPADVPVPAAPAPPSAAAVPPETTPIERAPADVRERGSEAQAPRVRQESREAPSADNQAPRDAIAKRKPERPPPTRAAARALSAPGPADVSGRLTMDDPRGGATALEDVGRGFGGSG